MIPKHQLLEHDPGCATDDCLRTLSYWGIKPFVVPHVNSGTPRSPLMKIISSFDWSHQRISLSTNQEQILYISLGIFQPKYIVDISSSLWDRGSNIYRIRGGARSIIGPGLKSLKTAVVVHQRLDGWPAVQLWSWTPIWLLVPLGLILGFWRWFVSSVCKSITELQYESY